MTTPLSVQLYSLGTEPAADPAGVVARLAALGYAGVEPVLDTGTPPAMREWMKNMGLPELPTVDSAALRRALDEHGMVAPSCHVPLPEGEHVQAVLDEQEMLGSTLLVVPGLFDADSGGLEAFSDLDHIKQIAERFNLAAEQARPRGIRIGYHNHFWEFGTDFDGRSGFEVFYELVEPDVFAEIDVYWAQLGGRNPAELIEALGERVLLLHVKDGDGNLGTPSSALGEGVVDLPAVLGAATSATWHVVELEDMGDAIWPALEQSHQYLVDGGFSHGRER